MGYVFVNVDTQKDYFVGEYKIPGATHIMGKLNDLTQGAKKYGVKVINTKGWYKGDSSEFSESPDYMVTYPKHCVMNTNGSQNIPETIPEQPFVIDWSVNTSIVFPMIHKSRNIVVNKDKLKIMRMGINEFAEPFDGNPYMESIMHNLGVPMMERPKYIIYGINVGPTALGLMKRGYDVHVVSDANINFTGTPLTKTDIIPQQTAPQDSNSLLGQEMSGMEYESSSEDTSIGFITTKEIIGE
jgi:nicotinamidase-related amidase